MARIGILGSGVVGTVLANGFLREGHEVFRGSRTPEKMADWLAAAGGAAECGTFADAATSAEIVVIAVKGSAARKALELAGVDNLAGKVVIDATNPIAGDPPENGVLRYFTDINRSLMEDLQEMVPAARFVKAFCCVGSAYMVHPQLPGGPPTMFICGNDEDARRVVTDILHTFGWEVADMGMAEAARAIEPLAMLWCIPGFREGNWMHAFKMLKAPGS